MGTTTPGGTSSADYCAALEKALLEAMGIFGEGATVAMVMTLKGKYGITLGSHLCSSIEEKPHLPR